MRKAIFLFLALLLPAGAFGQIGFLPETFGIATGGGGPYTLNGNSVSSSVYLESAAGSFVIGSVIVSTIGLPVGSTTVAITGTNAQGFRLSSSTLPSNLICPSGGCPAGAGPYNDFFITATNTSAAGSPRSDAVSVSGSPTQITAVSYPGSFLTSAAASSVIGAITTSVNGTAFSGTYSITGTNSGGFQISGSNLICNSSTGCPASATTFSDFNIVATQSGAIGSPFVQAASILGVAPYSGPGDAVSGATAWWGMRAYNLAYANANNKLFKARNGTTAETCDFLAATTGGVGVAANCSGSSNGVSLSTFQGAATLFVVTMYNQASGGSNYDITQATTGNQPTLVLNCTGSLPCLQVNGGSGVVQLVSAIASSVARPYTFESVAVRTSGSADLALLGANGGPEIFFSGSNVWKYYNGSSSAVFSQTDGTIHEFAANVPTGNVTGITDGTPVGSSVAGVNTTNQFFLGYVGNPGVENWFEGGIWPSIVTTTCHNPRLYYGLGGSC